MRGPVVVAVTAALLGVGCKGGEMPAAPAPTPVPAPEKAAPAQSAFGALEQEIFEPRCAAQPGCHMGAEPAGKLDLSAGRAYANLVNVKAERRPDRLRVAPGNSDGSYLLQRLSGVDTPLMPMGGKALSAAELDKIKAWVQEGAKP